jgi:glutaryl-CoA dehydrogenase (non-decarboxylating)
LNSSRIFNPVFSFFLENQVLDKGINMKLSAEIVAMQAAAREFAQNEIAPHADAWENGQGYPAEIYKKMADLGFFGVIFPEEYGGTDIGFLALAVITEELARASGTMRSSINLFATGTAYPIMTHGSREQKSKHLRSILKAETVVCFGISEPDAGADIFSMKTTAVPSGDFFIVNGTKTWISNACNADYIILYAYHDKSLGNKGLSAFLVPMDLPGISAHPIDTLGAKAMPPATVYFNEVKVPGDAVLGELGSGGRIMFSTLNQTRLICAAGALGLAQACLDESVKYCNQRVQFGQPIGEFQMIQDKIAQMVVEIEASRQLVYKAARQKDDGMITNTRAVTYAKYHAAKTVHLAADHAMSIHGAVGYASDSPISRYYREARVLSILEGSENILKTVIAKDKLGYKKLDKYE